MKGPRFESLRLGIVNPLTLVGRELTSILHERGIPFAKIELFDSSGADKGALTEVASEPAIVSELAPGSLEGLDIVFFCGPYSFNHPWIDRAEADGFIAIDLSQPTTLEADGLPVVAGVSDTPEKKETTIISPHPMVPPVVSLLAALSDLTLELAAVSAVQPASELGQEGVDELLAQTIGALNMQAIPKKVFDRQLAFNLYPPATANEIERLVTAQARMILGRELPLTVAVTQGTTFHGLTFSIFLRFADDIALDEVTRKLSRTETFLMSDADDLVSTIDAAGKDQVLIGRVAKDETLPGAFWIWMAVDNVRRSTALNAVLIAEELIARGSAKPN